MSRIQTLDRTRIDRLWGIERHAESGLAGQVVAPIIHLWDNPYKRQIVIAVAEHGEPCVVKARYQHPEDDRNYFLVIPAKAEWVGWGRRLRSFFERRPPAGWVSAPFLFTRGNKEIRGTL